jgi:hypothetical protein
MPLFDGYPCGWERAEAEPAPQHPGHIGGLAEFGNWVIEKLERAILNAPELQEHLAASPLAAQPPPSFRNVRRSIPSLLGPQLGQVEY